MLTLGAYQFSARLGDVRYNLDRMAAIIGGLAAGEVDVLAFPEMCDTGYAMDVVRREAMDWSTDHLQEIRHLARTKRTAVLIGLSERVEGSIFNAVAVITRTGELSFRYRKTHLVTIAPIHEERTITPGDSLGFFELDGLPCGVLTCYELRFPEIARTLVLRGARILFVPAAWPQARVAHLLTLTRARAIENQVFVVLAARTGTDGGTAFSGQSLVADPYGEVLASAGQAAEGLVTATVDLATIDACRGRITALTERRPGLYF